MALLCHPHHGIVREVSLAAKQPLERKVPATTEHVPSPASLKENSDPPCATCMPGRPVGCGHQACVMTSGEVLVG